MALIACDECGREISDRAPACPQCGAPVARARAGLAAVAPVADLPRAVEETLWEGSPSQWASFTKYLKWGWLIVPAIWFYLEIRSLKILVTNQRIKVTGGVLSRFTQEIELYRVRDTSVVQPFWYRIVGLADIVVRTTDASTPVITLSAIRNAEPLREQLRLAVEHSKERKGVRAMEMG